VRFRPARVLRTPVAFVAATAVGVALVVGAAAVLVWPRSDVPTGSAAAAATTATAASPTSDGTGGTASASPSSTATASAAASPSAPPPPAPRTGKPGADNTGVPAGTALTVVDGDQVFSRAGQVVSGLDIRGFVRVTAANVTIRDTVIRGRANPKCNSALLWVMNGASVTVEDSEIAPDFPHPCLDGIWATNAILTRMNIHGAVDGVKAYDNTTVQGSWIHDLSYFASDPNQGGGATHNDTVQTYEGNQHVILRHNTMDAGSKGNATYQVTQDGGKVATDLHVEDNWLDGGGCILNFSHKGGPTPMTGIYVVNNRFGRHSVYQCPILVSLETTLSANSGNVWDDTGAPIPAPQRHN
jgi:hypothetical protein